MIAGILLSFSLPNAAAATAFSMVMAFVSGQLFPIIVIKEVK